jgi:ADP-ribosylglycohydrolase
VSHFTRISNRIDPLTRGKDQECGFVVETLELPSVLSDYRQPTENAVLKAVNLGGDTDTNGGGRRWSCGLYYGFSETGIPRIGLISLLEG